MYSFILLCIQFMAINHHLLIVVLQKGLLKKIALLSFSKSKGKKKSIFGEGTFINHTNTFTTNLKLKRTNIVLVLAKKYPVLQQIWTFGPKKENILRAFTSNIHCIIIIEIWDYWVKGREVSSLPEEKVVNNSLWWARSAKHNIMI